MLRCKNLIQWQRADESTNYEGHSRGGAPTTICAARPLITAGPWMSHPDAIAYGGQIGPDVSAEGSYRICCQGALWRSIDWRWPRGNQERSTNTRFSFCALARVVFDCSGSLCGGRLQCCTGNATLQLLTYNGLETGRQGSCGAEILSRATAACCCWGHWLSRLHDVPHVGKVFLETTEESLWHAPCVKRVHWNDVSPVTGSRVCSDVLLQTVTFCSRIPLTVDCHQLEVTSQLMSLTAANVSS